MLLNTEKVDTLGELKVPGRIISVAFNKEATKFELTDYIKVSKKHRSNVVDVLVKDVFQYTLPEYVSSKKRSYSLNTLF